MTDRQDEHQPLGPAAALLEPFEGSAVQCECNVGPTITDKPRGLAMSQFAHLHRRAGVAMFELEQHSCEGLACQVFAQHKPDG